MSVEIKKQIERDTPVGAIKATRKDGKITIESLLTLSNIMRKYERNFHIEIVVHDKKGVTSCIKTIDTEKLALQTIENYTKSALQNFTEVSRK